MQTRRRFKQDMPLKERLALEAQSLRQQADNALPEEREQLLRKARQAETASHLSDWLRSPGLKAPA